MGKGKLAKFADIAANPLVVEFPFSSFETATFDLRGHWHDSFFHNDHPIVLELGCGRGEYTIGLARRNPKTNYIGVDIKGARMWHGARQALADDMKNVAFLRTNIEIIDRLFAPDEVSEIWLTFSDPQMKKATKRLTSTYFLERYRRFLRDAGLVHVKTDSPFMYTYTLALARHNSLPIPAATADLYADTGSALPPALREIQTYYEQMWRERGIAIKYLCLRLPHGAPLEEPDIDIPVDGYRSYGHPVRMTRKTGR